MEEVDFGRWEVEFGARTMTAYRVDLHAALVDLACREKVESVTGTRVRGLILRGGL